MKRAAYHNLGCKVNYYELQAVEDIMSGAGYVTVPFEDEADVYIVNTCSVTNMADHKSRQMIGRARSRNGKAIVIAMGCFVQGAVEDKQAINADIIIGNNRKHNIINDIEKYINEKNQIIDIEDINDSNVCYEDMNVHKMSEHTRAFIKIQDGCNEFCSYCIIPYMRGRVRSRDFDDILREIEELAKNGFMEFVLTGIHISSYCYSMQDGGVEKHLIDLIEAIGSIEGVKRIRLGSLEPRIITEEFVRRLVKVDKVCPHFHLSLQSGSNSVLRRMNRKYTTEEFHNSCVLLREYYNEPAITTDVIVGFPAESDEEFEETYNFLEKTHFYEMHIFQYSRRKGTRADKMAGQIPNAIKKERSNRLLELNKELSDGYRKKHIGKEVEVLFEEEIELNGGRYYQGYTKEYMKTFIKTDEDMSNIIIHCRVKEVTNNAILVEKIS